MLELSPFNVCLLCCQVSEKDVQAAKVDYEAMNAQLLEELPRFSALTLKLFRDCVGSFVTAQRDFTEKITHDMYDVLDVSVSRKS